ncbi:hypothetical protein [Xenorhabdus mauleonii]|nr:hypothetical protein [Xenorhabdus mauleonii]
MQNSEFLFKKERTKLEYNPMNSKFHCSGKGVANAPAPIWPFKGDG